MLLSSHLSAGWTFTSMLTLPALDAVGHSARLHVSPRTESPHCRYLLDDLPMCDLRDLEDVHDRISSILSTSCNSGLVICFRTCCVSFLATSWRTFTFSCTCSVLLRATSLTTSTYPATDRSKSSWPRVQGLISRRKARSYGRAPCISPNV